MAIKNSDLAGVLRYDMSSPSGLIWLVDVPSGSMGKTYRVRAGDFAGGVSQGGWKVRYNRQYFQAHRVIWELEVGSIPPGLMIDHIDGDRLNNLLTNLRVVPRELNARNAKRRVDNTTGHTGVKRQVNTRNGVTRVYYVANWKVGGRDTYECFSVARYGEEIARHMAISRRQSAITTLNANGAGYTERHGT